MINPENSELLLETIKIPGMSEVIRVYYNKSWTTLEEFLFLEQSALFNAHNHGWKLFKGYSTRHIPLIISKN